MYILACLFLHVAEPREEIPDFKTSPDPPATPSTPTTPKKDTSKPQVGFIQNLYYWYLVYHESAFLPTF